jgi:2-iminobutanoate/2-iminopropanoate deaminase
MKNTAIHTSGAPKPIAPYSPAIQVGNLLFISGQIAMDPIEQVYHPLPVEEETERVMKNIEALLDAAGMNWNNVVKASIFMKDMADYGKINDVYGKYVGQVPPAREAVQVSQLPRDCKVEISVIAHLEVL